MTSDFYLACFLLASGLHYCGSRYGDDPGRKEFSFEDSSKWDGLTGDFRCENPKVKVHDFVAAIRRLKSDLYGG